MIQRHITTLILAVFSLNCFGQVSDYYFKHLDLESGLSQNSVLSIFQDSKGFMWIGTKNGLNRYDGTRCKKFFRDETPFSLGNSTIYCIIEDDEKNVWVGTDKGVYIYNPFLENFVRLETKTSAGTFVDGNIRNLVKDSNGKIWILSGLGLYLYNTNNKEIKSINKTIITELVNPATILCIDKDDITWINSVDVGLIRFNDKDKTSTLCWKNTQAIISSIKDYKNNYLLIGTENEGLYKFNKQTNEISRLIIDVNNPNLFIRHIEQISENELWIATEQGLYILKDDTIKHLTHNSHDPFSLSDNAIYCIYKDNEEGIWIGTFFGGINYYPKQYSYFERYYHILYKNSLQGKVVREMSKDSSGNIWIATEDAGLNYFDVKTRQFKNHPILSQTHYNIQTVCISDNKLWVGTFSKGIDVFDLKTNSKKHYERSSSPYSLDNNDIFSIFTDQAAQTWVGTSTGVLLYDKSKDGFIKNNHIGTLFISDIIEDKNGYIWFATYNIGAIRYNPRTQESKIFSYDASNPKSICYDRITSIFRDSKDRLWFCSEDGGFCLFDEKNETFERITIKEGLPSNVTHKILEDINHTLWVTTSNGLVAYEPEKKRLKIYNTSNGLLNNQFNYKSGIKDNNGKLYFGGINGFIAFNPQKFEKNTYKPKIVFTQFRIFNKDVEIGKANSPLEESITYAKSVNLAYNQSSFSIEFSTLGFSSTKKYNYWYKLDGIDKDWIAINGKNEVSYNNISQGGYIFRVKALSNDEESMIDETSIIINVYPPFWRTVAAYIIYSLIIGLTTFYIFRNLKLKVDRKNRRIQEKIETQQKEELYKSKIDFFTNIAHEVRTPLTLIKGPIDYILHSDVNENEVKENLVVMEQNTDRLLTLINQLLDFRETESQFYRLNFERTNIKDLITKVFNRFETTAKQKGIEMHMSILDKAIFANVDPEAIIKIHSNLFNNAIKYAHKYINIEVCEHIESGLFQTRVDNDGASIADEYKDQIFEPFFQIKQAPQSHNSGSGIGLTLVKSLAKLHNGTIYINNEITDRTCFILQIPLNNEEQNSSEEINLLTDNTDLYITECTNTFSDVSILVVEDNCDLQDFIVKKLSKNYNIVKANNGNEALSILKNKVINLIISDIIMPEMDGIELCLKIKEDVEVSHIPIILLTAKTNMSSKIEGLRAGADAYIEKPFSINHLFVQIENLLDNRNTILNRYMNNPLITTNTIAQTKADEMFLKEITDIIMKNLDDAEFSIHHLAAAMNMSRTNLYRKIKGVSELTPGDFIRLIRLKKSAELLQEGTYRINEVCFIVGFASQSYFTKSFQKQFGVLPKDFLKSLKK